MPRIQPGEVRNPSGKTNVAKGRKTIAEAAKIREACERQAEILGHDSFATWLAWKSMAEEIPRFDHKGEVAGHTVGSIEHLRLAMQKGWANPREPIVIAAESSAAAAARQKSDDDNAAAFMERLNRTRAADAAGSVN